MDGPGLDADEARSQGQYEQLLADRFEDLQGILECENLVKLRPEVLSSAVSKAGHLTRMLNKALETDPGETSESYGKACNLSGELEDLLDCIASEMDVSSSIEHLEASNHRQALRELRHQGLTPWDLACLFRLHPRAVWPLMRPPDRQLAR